MKPGESLVVALGHSVDDFFSECDRAKPEDLKAAKVILEQTFQDETSREKELSQAAITYIVFLLEQKDP